MISAGRLRPNFVFRLSVNEAIGMSMMPSTIFAMTPNTAQTAAMTRSRPRKVWFATASFAKPLAMIALQR